MIPQAHATTIWIRSQKPTFDVVGVVLGSLGVAGILAVVALVLGSLFGVLLIRRTRNLPHLTEATSLHLTEATSLRLTRT